ncbi:MAG: Fe-S-cluster oxidoreductase [Betaproteobacteria bacterium]
MPRGKPAGVKCAQLTKENRCAIYEQADRPDICDSYQATEELCGPSRDDALRLLTELERITGDGRA